MASSSAASTPKLANPAVVGLAGFGLTTLVLQLHNLGLVGLGPVVWLGLIFGGKKPRPVRERGLDKI